MTEETPLSLFDDILSEYDYYYSNTLPDEVIPEKQLMFSVLIYAVVDYLSSNRKDNYKDARKWFFNKNNEADWIFSFENICFIMKINPIHFRKKLKKLKSKKIKFALDGKRIV